MEANLILIAASMVAGAVIWHFVHSKVMADIAALKADVGTLKTTVAGLLPGAPAAPAAPAAAPPASKTA